MILLLAGLLAGGADAPEDRSRATVAVPSNAHTITIPDIQPSEARWPGRFDRPPVAQWARDLPGGRLNAASHAERSRPLIDGSRILTGAAGGEALYAISRSDGRLLRTWPANGAVESDPVLDGDQLFYTDSTGTLWCARPDGDVVWSKPGEAPLPTRPTLSDDTVYVRDVADLVVARDRQTGEQRWRYRRRGDPSRLSELTLYAAPAVVVDEDQVLVGFSDGALVALDAQTGDVRWDLLVGEGRYPDLVAPPLADGERIYVSGYLGPLVALDRTSREVRWRLDVGSAAAPLLVPRAEGEGEMLVHPGTDGRLRAVDPISGDLLWSWDSDAGGALTTPVSTEAGLIVASSGGQLALVDPASGAERWRWSGEKVLLGITSSPAVEGRQIVFTTNAGRIHAMLAPQVRRLRPEPESRGFDVVDPPLDAWTRRR